MAVVTLLLGGAVLWVFIWVLMTLMQTFIFAGLTCATGFSCVYVGTHFETGDLFVIGDIGVSFSLIVTFFLAVATLRFGHTLMLELSKASDKIIKPFS